MIAAQLIERVDLRSSLWLTFWDLAKKRQFSYEIGNPTYDYRIGQLYRVDPRSKDERKALCPIADRQEIGNLATLIKVRAHSLKNLGCGGGSTSAPEFAKPDKVVSVTSSKSSVRSVS